MTPYQKTQRILEQAAARGRKSAEAMFSVCSECLGRGSVICDGCDESTPQVAQNCRKCWGRRERVCPKCGGNDAA